jgi:hypothetical protein
MGFGVVSRVGDNTLKILFNVSSNHPVITGQGRWQERLMSAESVDESASENIESTPCGLGRRTLIAGVGAMAAVGGIAAKAGAVPGPRGSDEPGRRHGIGDSRGGDIAMAVGRSREGRFGVMFKRAEAFAPPDELLKALAAQMGEPTSTNPTDFDNPEIPAGFTFLGQFIDHDITLDRTPLTEQAVDPHGLTNFDSPQFDLGSVYGRGRRLDPDLYEPGRSGRLRFARNVNGVDDLLRRADGTAVIGDSRNDENLIVAQMHLLFIKFHNRCLDLGLARDLAEARQLTRWHFQWILVHDFLEKVAGTDVIARFLTRRNNVVREFYRPRNSRRPYMPIEYSVAAYRFGHSMVRSAYLLNMRTAPPVVAPIFGAAGSDLRGSQPLPARLEIDWRHFFTIPGQPEFPRNQSRRIDGKLSLPLFNLPPTVVSDAITSLAERNLLRGKRLGLPAGQDVAARMGVTPLSNAELGLPDPDNPGWNGKAPLWFYLLKEAELQRAGLRLGEVGGRIVTEVILGLLNADRNSYLHSRRFFTPSPPIAAVRGEFRMGDLIKFAQG